MIRSLLFLFCAFSFILSAAQTENGFPFGKITVEEILAKKYEKDTTAAAFYINEFGEASILEDDDMNLMFRYHAKIKILTSEGLDVANFSIPIHKYFGKSEILRSVKASTFTLTNGTLKETKLDAGNVFTENRGKNLDNKKFALPNVQVGSVIEVEYELESPYIFNFRPWEFQSELPKKKSEFWATIPGNYVYNMSLRGFLKFSSSASEVLNDCFRPAGNRADCARYKFVMQDVPAFVEEDYMTVSSNFLSTLNFELSEIKYFDGRVDKFTKEWNDVEQELKHEERFGLQLRRGKDIVDEKVEQAIAGETNELERAKKIYEFIRNWYQWDEVSGKYSEFGIRKAFDTKKGNVGDINLSLIAALKYANLSTEPLILSTRDNGLPVEVHPVLSEFNYVIAKLNIADKVYLLDATDRFVPFGVLPIRCLNGKGRVFGEKESYWYELKPSDKKKKVITADLVLEKDGHFRGTIQNVYAGYEAIQKRREIETFLSPDEYKKDLDSKLKGMDILKLHHDHLDDLSKPLFEKMEVDVEGFDNLENQTFFFNPFFVERWSKNPFRSTERLYPVDFGVPIEEVIVISIALPPGFDVIDLPGKVGLALPDNGGRYIFSAQNMGNKIVITHSLLISRAVYSPGEYHYLKELFNHVIQVQNIDLVFKKMK